MKKRKKILPEQADAIFHDVLREGVHDILECWDRVADLENKGAASEFGRRDDAPRINQNASQEASQNAASRGRK